MTIANAKIERYNETHMLGTAMLTHAKGTEEVRFVAPVPPQDQFDPHGEPKLDSAARYFSSPLIARTNWDDVSTGAKLAPAFTGRELFDMQSHLSKNFK